jgi:hypothetical protein
MATWCGLVTVMIGMIAWMSRQMHRVSQMLDDWRGTEARPGVPRRPGVMERLEKIENDVSRVVKNTEEK